MSPVRLAPCFVAVAAVITACAGGTTLRDTAGQAATKVEKRRVVVPRPSVVRGCDRYRTGVGYGGVSAARQRRALRVGPISLGSLGTIRRQQLPETKAGQQRFYPLESVAVVRAGAKVTLAIPASERQFVGFIYDQEKFRADGRYRVRDLDWVVRFEACKDPGFNGGISQFDGGVVVAGRRCFHLDFYVNGRNTAVRRRVPPTGRCGP